MEGLPLLTSLTGDAEISALFSAEAEIEAMCRVEAALAEAQGGCGMIPADAAKRIAASWRAAAVDEARLRKGFARDGVPVPDLVAQLKATAGLEDAPFVHRGATSQDIVDTGLMLRLSAVVDRLDARLAALDDRLAELGRREGHHPLMAHTRMQAALPFTVAAKLRTWADPLPRHHAALARLRSDCLCVQLGGPIGDGSSFGERGATLAADLAQRLGLSDAAPWHSARDRMLGIGQVLTAISGTCGKIGQDIALMAQNEVAAIRLSGGGGSSAMAHKQNPVAAEILVTLARLNAGLLGILAQAMVHENERSGAAWTLEWLVLPQIAEGAGAGLRIADQLLASASFNVG